MGSIDKIFGGCACIAAAFVFIYYTTWALITPFLEESNALLSYFPPHHWAIYLPASILFLALSLITLFFIKTTQKKAKSK
ncbi:dolichol phosphate-mannose biosynthesis regulatory [Sporodiniella umbellata]|nr:dolichol phosphate-mannose biosynthesis regulatory [Sporodiniella umbellata]